MSLIRKYPYDRYYLALLGTDASSWQHSPTLVCVHVVNKFSLPNSSPIYNSSWKPTWTITLQRPEKKDDLLLLHKYRVIFLTPPCILHRSRSRSSLLRLQNPLRWVRRMFLEQSNPLFTNVLRRVWHFKAPLEFGNFEHSIYRWHPC